MAKTHLQFISNWSATVVAPGGSPNYDTITLSTADVAALAALVGQTSLGAGYQGIPVSLFDAAGAYLGPANIVEFDSTGSGMADDLVVIDNNGYTTLDAGGTLACRINPEWLEPDAAHRHARAHTQGSGTLTLEKHCLNRDITVTAPCTLQPPHSSEMQKDWSGRANAERRHELILWLYDNDNDQPAVTFSGQTLFYVTDTIRWADGSAPSFSGGYRLLQVRLVLMGSGSTWLGAWTKYSDR